MSTATVSPVIITVRISLKKGSGPSFTVWQGRLNHQITSAPGFVSLEIASSKTEDAPWIITQRFNTPENASAWKNSPSFLSLMDELDRYAIQNGVQFSSPVEDALGCVTEVFVTDVANEHITAFNEWSSRIHLEEAKHPGFKGVYLQSPLQSKGKHWITMLQFDTVEHLDKWLASPERKQILSEPHPWLSTLESHRVISPYGGWFSSIATGGKVPPAWKQTMIVLMILFPIVMLTMAYLSPFLTGLNRALAIFISNIVSVTLIAWPGTPLSAKALGWWLLPEGPNASRATLWGTLLVVFIYLCEIAFFWNFLG